MSSAAVIPMQLTHTWGSGAHTRPTGSGQWYALQTRSRHEKKVAAQFEEKGIPYYLPLVRATHCWSDRRKQVELPLFPGYAFVRLASPTDRRVEVLQTPGVVKFVGIRNTALPIPDKQIQDVRQVMENGTGYGPHPYINLGQRVRVRGGCLEGVEGILVSYQNQQSLVISLDVIQRSMAIRVCDYEVEAA